MRYVRIPGIGGRSRIGAGGALVAVAAMLAGCGADDVLPRLAVPVAYRSVTLVAGDRGALHAVAGLYVELANVSTRTIAEVDLAFELFREGEPLPGPGANDFGVTVAARIAPGETASLCVSLDAVPGSGEAGVVARRVRARSVRFEDGTRWWNTGAHVYREEAS